MFIIFVGNIRKATCNWQWTDSPLRPITDATLRAKSNTLYYYFTPHQNKQKCRKI